MPANAAEPNYLYDTQEEVLAYHGPLIHEAVVRERDWRDSPDGKYKIRLYLLHYTNSNAHWDEWVPESRVLKKTAQNTQMQKDRVKDFQKAHKRKLKNEASGSGSAGPSSANKKAKPSEASEESLLAELKESLRLPHGMKLKLIEDWEHITREKKLVPLPRTPSISQLLEDFQAAKARRTSHERLYGEVCDGVRAYFNQALPTILLYKYERKQFNEAKEAQKKTPAEIYGAEHLLRLYSKFPELLAVCALQREHMTVLNAKLGELIKFLQTNKAKYFVSEYSCPPSEYLQWWEQES